MEDILAPEAPGQDRLSRPGLRRTPGAVLWRAGSAPWPSARRWMCPAGPASGPSTRPPGGHCPGEGGPRPSLRSQAVSARLQGGLRAAFAALSAEDRNALRLSVMEGLSIDQLADRPSPVHRGTPPHADPDGAARGHQTGLARSPQADERETLSLLALLRSSLHVSLTRLFAATSRPQARVTT